MVTLIEKKKENKEVQREFTTNVELAQKMLRKSRGWELKKESLYILKDGSLLPKEEQNKAYKKDK